MKYSVFFFDLDGTLTDPADGICGSIQYALEKGGYTVESKDHYFNWIGPPLLNSFEKYLGVDADRAKELLVFYRERFSTIGLFENIVYPGIPELLSKIHAAGGKMVVATGKPTVFSERILEHFGLLDYFEIVSGIPLDESPMDKHDVINAGLEYLNVTDLSRCVMIGDRDSDIIGAKMCGIDSVYVLYGYGSVSEAEASDAKRIVASVSELEKLLLEDTL